MWKGRAEDGSWDSDVGLTLEGRACVGNALLFCFPLYPVKGLDSAVLVLKALVVICVSLYCSTLPVLLEPSVYLFPLALVSSLRIGAGQSWSEKGKQDCGWVE